MKTIPLTKGFVAMVDDADYEWLMENNWQVHSGWKTNYAYRVEKIKAVRQGVFMHRAILGLSPGTGNVVGTDHKDGNGLNNQRSNIRVASLSLNNANKAVRPDSRTGYKGVAILTHGRHRNRIYQARLTFNHDFYFLGNWPTPEEAARAYDAKALEVFGEFARLNFPNTPQP